MNENDIMRCVVAERDACATLAEAHAARYREKCEAEFYKASRGHSDATMYRVYGGAADAAQEIAETIRSSVRADPVALAAARDGYD